MLDELKNLFENNSVIIVTEVLKGTQQLVSFVEAVCQDPQSKIIDRHKVNAAIDHIKVILEGHKK